MPNSTHAMHPTGRLGITFTEEDHSYIDDFGIEYTSGTTLVHGAFEPFDAPKAAAAKSARTGVPAAEYIREWEDNRDCAADAGTRTHENCERQILGRYADMNQPRDDEERARFRAAWFEVERMKANFETLEPEKLVFSPRFRASGSIDLMARRRDGNYCMFDWKFIKELRREAFGNRTGIHLATRHLPDCNFCHYGLQLNIYEQILKVEGYIPPTAAVDKFLAVYNRRTQAFDFVRMPDFGREALLLMAWNATSDNLEDIPF
jgi:ATP-dependent exoDNAse (exonuclease V) beta subunit